MAFPLHPIKPREANASHQCGFVLMESLVSLLMLAGGILSVFALSNQVLRINQLSQKLTEATAVAEMAAEELFQMDYDTIQTGYQCHGDYERRFIVNSIDSGLTKEVTVRVVWRDTNNSERRLDFNTLVSSFKPDL